MTGEHDRKGALPSNPTRHTRESGHYEKKGAQPKGCVKPGTRGGAHNQRRAHDRGARPRSVLHQETRRAAQEQVGAQPKACARQGSTTERVLHPETRHAAHEKVGTKKKGAHNPTGASNPEHGAALTTKGVLPKGVHDVSHPETRHTRALREHSPGACVTSGTGRSARRTAVAVCRRPREGDAFEQDRPSTCAQTGMSVVPSRLGRSGSLVRF